MLSGLRGLPDERARQLIRPDDRLTFLYAGLMGLAQGLGQILDLADRLRRRSDIRFVLVGDGPMKLDLEVS